MKDALPIAIQLHQTGHLEAARQMYERILKLTPRQANAVHFLGVLHHQMGEHDRAAAMMVPEQAGAFTQLRLFIQRHKTL
ncbi:MAG: hypothetical protein V4532_04455, partial [Pseudomonadota bacterium]